MVVHWDDYGYIVLRKQPNPTPVRSDYIDVVKYDRTLNFVFTGVPDSSGMDVSDPVVDVGSNSQEQLATRGGVSGNFSSCTYTGYNIANDFTTQTEASTTIQNSSSPPLTNNNNT